MNKMKKVLISLFTILIAIFLIYQGYKVIARSTNEMISFGDGLPADFSYITYEDLINEKDILCCGRGITLIGSGRTNVIAGNHTQSESHLTMNDIGKKLFEEEQSASGYVTSESFANPYSSATSYTYGHYNESATKVASPAESYILAEIFLKKSVLFLELKHQGRRFGPKEND